MLVKRYMVMKNYESWLQRSATAKLITLIINCRHDTIIVRILESQRTYERSSNAAFNTYRKLINIFPNIHWSMKFQELLEIKYFLITQFFN